MEVQIRPARRSDMANWLRLRRALWPGHDEDDWTREMLSMLARRHRRAVFVAVAQHSVVGFLEASLRDYADGCATSPVGYIEGWYVEPQYRRTGVGRALVAAAERWAMQKGCTEMASDALLENSLSHQAHRALGYEEVERAVRFRKSLGRPVPNKESLRGRAGG